MADIMTDIMTELYLYDGFCGICRIDFVPGEILVTRVYSFGIMDAEVSVC